MPNQYVEFVKQWSKDNGLSYMCSIGDPRLKADYLNFKAGEPYGKEIDFQPKSKKKSSAKMERSGMGLEDVNVGMPRSKINTAQLINKLQQIKELASMGKQDRNVGLNISNLINQLEEEIVLTPAPKKKSKKQSKPKVELVEEEPTPVPKSKPVPKAKIVLQTISNYEIESILQRANWMGESFDRILRKLKTTNLTVKEFNSQKKEYIQNLKEAIDDLTNKRKKYHRDYEGEIGVIFASNKLVNLLEDFKKLKFDKNALTTYLKEIAEIKDLRDGELTTKFSELKNMLSKTTDEKIIILIEKAIDNLQQIYDEKNKQLALTKQEEKCLELFEKLNIVTRSDLNKQFVKYKNEARANGFQEFEKYPPYIELSNCRGVFEAQLLKNPQQAKPSARAGPVVPVGVQAKPLLLKYLSREELYKLIEAKATPASPTEKTKSPIEIIETESKRIVEEIINEIKILLSKIPNRTKSENRKVNKDLFIKVKDILDAMRNKSKSSTKELSDILNIYINKIDKLADDIAIIAPSTYKSKSQLKKYFD